MSIVVGIHQQYQGNVDRHEPDETLDIYPRTEATREFTSGYMLEPQNLIPKIEATCRKVWNQGLIAVWSFKPDSKAVSKGTWRPYLQQVADYLKTNRLDEKTIVVIWHEPENDFVEPKNFVNMFNTVHDTLKATAPKLLTCHAALGYRYRPNGEVKNPADWKTKADIHAIDLYQGRSFPLNQIMPENPAFKRWHAELVGGDAWAVTERGWVNSVDRGLTRAETIRREADWLATVRDKCLLYLVWDTVGSEGDKGLPIRDADGVAAVQYLMEQVQGPLEPEPEPEPPTDTTDCPLCHGTGKVKRGQTITIVQPT
jgi:hypothetical protein